MLSSDYLLIASREASCSAVTSQQPKTIICLRQRQNEGRRRKVLRRVVFISRQTPVVIIRALLKGENGALDHIHVWHQYTALSQKDLAEKEHYHIRIRLSDFPQWRPKLHLVDCKENTIRMKRVLCSVHTELWVL